jgi:hypothetical protein
MGMIQLKHLIPICKEVAMSRWLKGLVVGISVLVWSAAAFGEEIPKEQVKGLDEQVQEIKSDVLSISAELNQLEEKLLYPSNTQVAVFLSLAEGESFRLDSVDIQLDGNPVTHHLYTFKELEALQKGGVQKIFTGNVQSGEHDLLVSVMGKNGGGSDFEKSGRFKVNKEVGPKIVEISLAAQGITFNDR